MKFEIKVKLRNTPDSDAWVEQYDEKVRSPKAWAAELIRIHNKGNEFPFTHRVLLGVKIHRKDAA